MIQNTAGIIRITNTRHPKCKDNVKKKNLYLIYRYNYSHIDNKEAVIW